MLMVWFVDVPGACRRDNAHLTSDEAAAFVDGVTDIVQSVSLTSFNLASSCCGLVVVCNCGFVHTRHGWMALVFG